MLFSSLRLMALYAIVSLAGCLSHESPVASKAGGEGDVDGDTVITRSVASDSDAAKHMEDECVTSDGNWLTDVWAVRLEAAADPVKVAKEYGAEYLGTVGALANTYLIQRPPHTVPENGPDPLANDPRVLWLERQIARQQFPRPDTKDGRDDACAADK